MAHASIVTGLVAAFYWGTADQKSRSQSERVGSHRTIIHSHMVTLIAVLVLVPIISPNLAFPVYPILALFGAGVIDFAAFVFLYRTFHRGVVSAVAPWFTPILWSRPSQEWEAQLP